MTIKQAFEKLTAVTAAAMKNPFFVMRKLHDAFADIADKIEGGGGGGSTVEVTQVLESGTKIATITVDDTPTDLYAPAASSQNYSTTERVVGKWIDGTTDVYEKTYTAESVSTAQALYIPHGITGLDTVISLFGGCKTTDRFYPLPFVENDISYQRYLAATATDIIVGNASNAMAITKIVIVIRYLKATT